MTPLVPSSSTFDQTTAELQEWEKESDPREWETQPIKKIKPPVSPKQTNKTKKVPAKVKLDVNKSKDSKKVSSNSTIKINSRSPIRK